MEIWKYKLAIADRQLVQMPVDSEILSVGNQQGAVCLWAKGDPTAVTRNRVIEMIGTGHPISPARRTFLGTVLDDPFVWHVFERHQ